MHVLIFSPGQSDAGTRLDLYLAKESLAPSRSHVQKLIGDGRVRVNGRVEARASYRVRTGDTIEVEVPPAPRRPSLPRPEQIELDVIYEDDDLMVVNKPRGMVVHPGVGRRSGTLVNALLGRGIKLSTVAGEFRPGIVHRLDRNTSGAIIVAKNDEVHLALSSALASGEIERNYIAIVRGDIQDARGTIDAPLGRNPVNRMRRAVRRGGRRAVTKFAVLERFGDYTLVGIELETGRMHQIRVHMSHIGRPVAGDSAYGGVPGELGLEGQALHAQSVEFTHPGTGERVRFEAEKWPDDMRAALEQLRSRRP